MAGRGRDGSDSQAEGARAVMVIGKREIMDRQIERLVRGERILQVKISGRY